MLLKWFSKKFYQLSPHTFHRSKLVSIQVALLIISLFPKLYAKKSFPLLTLIPTANFGEDKATVWGTPVTHNCNLTMYPKVLLAKLKPHSLGSCIFRHYQASRQLHHPLFHLAVFSYTWSRNTNTERTNKKNVLSKKDTSKICEE